MGIYNFEGQTRVTTELPRGQYGHMEPDPILPTAPPQFPDTTKRVEVVQDPINSAHYEDIVPVYEPGYHYLDEGMKRYFGEIRIPTRDSYRKMAVKIAGGDKSILIWKNELEESLKDGRPILPVMSINRTGEQFNPMKFSPPYMPIAKKFATADKTRLQLVYRPTPSLVSYQMTIWSEHKRDAEYALYDIRTRFNPLAEFLADDNQTVGNVILRYEGMIDSSDKEAEASAQAKYRYDINLTAEAWLPLPTRLMPSVLGRVTQLAEFSGEIFGTLFGNSFADYKEALPNGGTEAL